MLFLLQAAPTAAFSGAAWLCATAPGSTLCPVRRLHKKWGTVKPGTLYVFLFYTEGLPDDCNLHFLPYLNLWPRVGASGKVGANMYFLNFSDLIKCE